MWFGLGDSEPGARCYTLDDLVVAFTGIWVAVFRGRRRVSSIVFGDGRMKEFALPVRAPFDLALTVGVLRRLPGSALYTLTNDEFRFLAPLTAKHRLLGVRIVSSGEEVDSLRVRALDGDLGESEVAQARAMITWMLDVERDLSPLRQLTANEPEASSLVERLTGMKPPRFLSLWEAFCQIVPFQLVSLSSAIATLNRFVLALGPHQMYEGREYLGIPSPAVVLAEGPAVLRSCGLSEAKARTLLVLAERTLAGELATDAFAALSDTAAIAQLTAIPGIGPWSAQVALLRGLGRLSVFPTGDSGATRGLSELLAERRDPSAAAKELLDRMGEWRGYLYFILLGRRLLSSDSH